MKHRKTANKKYSPNIFFESYFLGFACASGSENVIDTLRCINAFDNSDLSPKQINQALWNFKLRNLHTFIDFQHHIARCLSASSIDIESVHIAKNKALKNILWSGFFDGSVYASGRDVVHSNVDSEFEEFYRSEILSKIKSP